MKFYTLNFRLPTLFPECFYSGLYSLRSKSEKNLFSDSSWPKRKDFRILTLRVLQGYGPGRPLPGASWAALIHGT